MKFLIVLFLSLSAIGQYPQNIVIPTGIPGLSVATDNGEYLVRLSFPQVITNQVVEPYVACDGIVYGFIDFEDPGLTEYYINIPMYNSFFPFTLQQPWIDGDIVYSPNVFPIPTMPYTYFSYGNVSTAVNPIGIGVMEFVYVNFTSVFNINSPTGFVYEAFNIPVFAFPEDPVLFGKTVEFHGIMNLNSNHFGTGNIYVFTSAIL